MNKDYSLILPRKIVFKPGATAELAAELPVDKVRVLFVAGNHAAKDGTAERLAESLRGAGKSVQIIGGISPEPPLDDVDRVIRAGREFNAEIVVALGGGSIIDTAKAAAAVIPFDTTCKPFFSGEKNIPGKGLFFAALPTTAGTGAEMTKNSVLTEVETKVKKSLRSPYMTADLVLIDPLLTLDCPPNTTAASGLDAFVQAVEAFTNPKATAYSRSLAATAARKISGSLVQAWSNPHDIDARTAVAEGSMLAGMAFAPCGLGAVHGLAHPIGSLLHVPHGIACAVLMPYIFKLNAGIGEPLASAAGDYAELAATIGIRPPSGTKNADMVNVLAKKFVAHCTRLTKALNVPKTFAGYGLKQEHFPFIIANCRSASMKSNPVYLSDEVIEKLLKKLSK